MTCRTALLPFVLLPAIVVASVWQPLDDKDFTAALTYGIEIANSKTAPSPYPYVRVYAVPDEIGECRGTLDSCPDWALYIAISMGDLYEEPFLYRFPITSNGWKFTGWQQTSEAQTVIFTVTTTLPSSNLDSEVRDSWKPENFEFFVTPNGPTVSIVSPNDGVIVE